MTTRSKEAAADHRLPVGGEADPAQAVLEVEDVEDQAEQEGAGQGSADRADAAGQQRAADDDRGDREQLPADSLGRLAGAELGRQDHAGEAGQGAAEGVDQELHPVDRQAHQAGRVLAAADRQDVAAEGGEVEQYPSEDDRPPPPSAPVPGGPVGRPGRAR